MNQQESVQDNWGVFWMLQQCNIGSEFGRILKINFCIYYKYINALSMEGSIRDQAFLLLQLIET